MFVRIILSCTLVLCASAAARADGNRLAEDSSLENFLRIAAEESPALRAAYESWMAEVAVIGHARGWPDPQLSYTHYLSSVETALGPQEHAIALRQRIPWFGKLGLKGNAAEAAAAAERQRFEDARLALHQRVAAAYYDNAFLARAIDINRESLELYRYQESVARARYRTDSTSYSDLIRIQVELGILEDRVRSLEEQRAPLAAELNASLGRDAQSPLPWPLALAEDETVLAAIRERNPRLLALSHESARAGELGELARRERMPDLTVGLQTILTAESELTAFEDRGRDAWMATVSLNLPLWRGKYDSRIRQADATERKVQYLREDEGRSLAARAERLLFDMRDAERKIDLFGASLVPKARQALEATATGFATGKASFLDFVDAQRNLLQFELELARAQAARGKYIVEIARSMGDTPIKDGGPQ